TANQQSVARRNAATVSRWRRAYDRASNWRVDRYDDYPRDGDRRFRAARDDDFLMGRAERHEGPLMMVPSVRYRWCRRSLLAAGRASGAITRERPQRLLRRTSI